MTKTAPNSFNYLDRVQMYRESEEELDKKIIKSVANKTDTVTISSVESMNKNSQTKDVVSNNNKEPVLLPIEFENNVFALKTPQTRLTRLPIDCMAKPMYLAGVSDDSEMAGAVTINQREGRGVVWTLKNNEKAVAPRYMPIPSRVRSGDIHSEMLQVRKTSLFVSCSLTDSVSIKSKMDMFREDGMKRIEDIKGMKMRNLGKEEVRLRYQMNACFEKNIKREMQEKKVAKERRKVELENKIKLESKSKVDGGSDGSSFTLSANAAASHAEPVFSSEENLTASK
jgi:hypothetical protein